MRQLYKEDAALLNEISEGDVSSFNELYTRHWKFVYNQAYKRLSDHDQAEDITQDIFCKIWVNRASLSITNLPAYFSIAVRNRVFNLFEKEKRFVPVKDLLAGIVASEQADANALKNEFMAAYKSLIESLPAKRKSIFLQYYDLGKSTEEIAAQLVC